MKEKLTYREIIREFLFFLKKENAYERYIKEIKRQNKRELKNWGNYINVLTIDSLKNCFKNDSTRYSNIGYLIYNAFLWSATKEGFDFWSALDTKWSYKMRNIEMINEKTNK